MKLKITAIRDAGNLAKERVVMKAVESADVGNFMLIRTGYYNDEVTIDVRNAFWFPVKKVSAGDIVVVYTKSGTANSKDFNSAKSHFFYWGVTEPIWAAEDTSAVLLNAPEWESFREKA